MTGSELYTHVNETLRVLVWPITAIVLAGFLRSPVVRIFDRFAMLEGSVGGIHSRFHWRNTFRRPFPKQWTLRGKAALMRRKNWSRVRVVWLLSHSAFQMTI